MDKVDAADFPGIGLEFVWFPKADASGAAGNATASPR
jgi:hypothetical protein